MQELAKQFTHTMQLHKVDVSSITFEVLEFNEDKTPRKVKRFKDQEVFTIGDHVTNGTKMKGIITGFELYKGQDSRDLTMYVSHTWSNVGMGLEDIYKTEKLPSRFQIGEEVSIKQEEFYVKRAEIIKVHFANNSVQYDLEIKIKNFLGQGLVTTRIYNVNELLVGKG